MSTCILLCWLLALPATRCQTPLADQRRSHQWYWLLQKLRVPGNEHLNKQAESPQSPEEESPVGNPDAGFPLLTRGRVTNLPKMSFLMATTLIYTNGAGITTAAGTRLNLNCIGHRNITFGHKMSLCTAFTSSWLGGTNTAFMGMSACSAYTPSWL